MFSGEVQPNLAGRTPTSRVLDPVHAHLFFMPRPCLTGEEATITRSIERLLVVVPHELYLAVSSRLRQRKSIFLLLHSAWWRYQVSSI